jgi:hypothetical protein
MNKVIKHQRILGERKSSKGKKVNFTLEQAMKVRGGVEV